MPAAWASIPAPTAVLNGRDPALFHPDPAARAALRAELGAGEAAIASSSPSPAWCATRAIRSCCRRWRRCRAPALWVVGERLATDHGAGPRARISPAPRRRSGRACAGSATATTSPRLLAAADVFALPSHFEGLPMSVIEAMLTGLPVVATDIRGPREMVPTGRPACWCRPATVAPLAEALTALAADPALRARLGAAGRARALALFDEASGDLGERGSLGL